jgi:hypothetical protein
VRAKQPAQTEPDQLQQYERALSLLCGLHSCITVHGPPELVAQQIFEQVAADQRALRERVASLERTLEDFRSLLSKKNPPA